MDRVDKEVYDEEQAGSEKDPITSEEEEKRQSAPDVNVDALHPLYWSLGRKLPLTVLSCLLCFAIGINSLSIASAAGDINARFNVSDESFPNSYWAVTTWNGGAIIGPLIGLPIIEEFGLRKIYLTYFALFVIFVIPQAVAQNYATLLVSRFFAGAFGSVVQNAVANVVGDIWSEEQSYIPMTFFVYCYLQGYTFGPIFGSAVLTGLEWRWILYIQIIIYGALFVISWFLVVETKASLLTQIESRRADSTVSLRDRSERIGRLARTVAIAAFRPLRLFATEPVLFFSCLWSAVAIGNIFLASQSIAQTYGAVYSFTEIQSGFVQVSMIIGGTIAVPFCLFQNYLWVSSRKRNTENPGKPIPEWRLQMSIIFSFLGMAGGLFVYGWTLYPSVPWIAPTIGLGLVGAGIMVVVHAAGLYITDAYGIYAGSGIAAFATTENVLAAFLPLATQSMYRNLGFHWASTLLAFIAVALSFAPVVLFWKGHVFRARSPFMNSGAADKATIER